MRLLICGGRDYTNYRAFSNWMSVWLSRNFKNIPTVLIHGGASGVDTMAKNWGMALGMEVIEFPANWEKYGKRAGYLRNVEMVDNGKPDKVIAFPGGKGTQMMIKLALARGIPVEIAREEDLKRYG